jgi:DNA topoisomerase-1
MAFISSSWWDLNAQTDLGFTARLLSVDGKKVAATADFGADGAVKEKSLANILLLDETGARSLVESLKGTPLTVKSMEEAVAAFKKIFKATASAAINEAAAEALDSEASEKIIKHVPPAVKK